jgi:hypothetical protein
LPAGSHKIAAAYAGDNSFNASTSGTNTISITQATTTTATNSSATSIASGATVTLTAIVSSNSNSTQGPTGTVQFLNGGVSLGAAATCTAAGATKNSGASCTATLQTALSALPPGIVDVRPPSSPFVYLAWLAATLAMMAFVLSMMLAAKRKQCVYAGVGFFLIAAAVLAGCGGGSSSTGGGGSTRSITAKYSGDANYAGSTSSAITVTIQ